jgi:hypothetical protein
MTAYNLPCEGMANSRESAILSAVAEALTWKHALEVDGPRKGQRVVIYPKELTQLDQVLSTGDPTIDSEDGHPIAYATILQAAQSFERMPLFLREDHQQITSDPTWSVEVPKWLNTASRVATGSRRRVLENGPDVMRSDEEDALKDEHGEELTGVYAPGCSSLDQARLTAEQAVAQRAASSPSTPASTPREPPRSQSPAISSSDDDDLSQSEWIWSQTKGCVRKNKAWVKRIAESALALPAPEPQKALPAPDLKALPAPDPKELKAPSAPEPKQRIPTPVNSDDEGNLSEDQKRHLATAKKMSKRSTAQSTSRLKPVTEAQAAQPMETRRQAASRAGGLRPGGGSGQTGTCVAQGNPSKT